MFRRMIVLVVLVGLLVAAVYGSTHLFSQIGEPKTSSALIHKVAKGDLIVSVTEDGNLESASNIEIKCQVAGGSAILWIVGDGQEVKKGDKLVDLDTAVLDEQINGQRITLEKARSTMVQAEKDYQVAEISVKEYIEGTYKQELQTKDAQITISLENLRSAQNGLEHSQRMFRKGYISSLELESQQFAVQRAQLELDSAKTAKEVLEKFTKTKMLEDLESKVETAKARLESERASFSLEESKLKRLEAQREFCSIKAPQDGMVVYANEQGGRMGGNQQVTIEEGAGVRERQTILRLPDLSQMQVKVLVHESKVDLLGRGMRARIRIQGRDLQGTVTNIANQPEPTGFFSANVKEYATIVRIDGQPDGLKPGMTAEVEILVSHLKDVLTMPVAAVVDQRNKFYCWVRKPFGEPERRPLLLGLNSDQFVEVKDGVQVGEEVLLNPRAVVLEARQEASNDEPVDVSKKFGEAKGPVEAPEPGGRTKGSGNGPGAPDGGGPGGGPGGGRTGGGPGGGGGGRVDWMSHDKNGDGKVSKDEAPETVQNFFDNVDANKDGFVDQAEIEAMRARRGAGGGGGGQRGNLMSNDKDGDGKVSRDEAPAFMQSFFDRMDANGDGFVDQEEADAARRQFEKGGGGGGPGGPPR